MMNRLMIVACWRKHSTGQTDGRCPTPTQSMKIFVSIVRRSADRLFQEVGLAVDEETARSPCK